jgi:aspartyl-tRNA(Asn)/glutamyl-tRNA(Gln) amidotransferase subunit A
VLHQAQQELPSNYHRLKPAYSIKVLKMPNNDQNKSSNQSTNSTPLHLFTTEQMLAGYAAKQFSPLEVMRSVIEQMQRLEPKLAAGYLFRPEDAMQAAKKSEQRWLTGQATGALDGIPVTIKENLATKGDPMPAGTAAVNAVAATDDAPVAARLREAGAIMVSKTTMPDYGMLSSGLSTFHQLSRNPWDTSKGPGGSSAGAGSAAAAGYGPLHVGTDIGGSVRLPANWCGLVGLKPSNGRVPIDPPYTGRAAGPMTRNVSDAAHMMAVMAQPDRRDSMSLPGQILDWHSVQTMPSEQALAFVKGKRVGLLLDAGCGMSLDPRVKQHVEQAAIALAKAGAIIEPMQPFMTPAMLQGLDEYWRMRSLIDLDSLPTENRARCLPFILEWAEGARGLTGEQIFKASHQIYVTRVSAVKACSAYDFVLSPTAPVMAFKAENASPNNDPVRSLEHIGFTVPFNMSEQPAVSVNFSYERNENALEMPVGVQIIGQRFDDIGVLKMARVIEAIRPAQRPWPIY